MSNPANFEERLTIAVDTFAAIIAADAYLAVVPAVPVITEDKGDIAAMINQAMSKLGLCVVCVSAEGDKLERRGSTLRVRCRIAAQVSEKVMINKSACAAAGIAYRPARATALRIMKAVDKKPNGLDPAGGRHVADINEFELILDRPFELVNNPRDVVYEVSVHTWIDL